MAHSETPQAVRPAPDLKLYAFPSCPFCMRVSRALDDLGLEVEYEDINQKPEALQALVEARGRRTVPVLRIEQQEGQTTWMPESSDIISYLYERFGEGKPPPRCKGFFGFFGW